MGHRDDREIVEVRGIWTKGQSLEPAWQLDFGYRVTVEGRPTIKTTLSFEPPPDFVAFMFASTHPQEFPPAILSRLQRFDVRRLTTDEISGKPAVIDVPRGKGGYNYYRYAYGYYYGSRYGSDDAKSLADPKRTSSRVEALVHSS